jgi:hypothetical protein
MASSSSALTSERRTILGTAIKILKDSPCPLSPKEIVNKAFANRMLRIPHGKNKAYVYQLMQSTLYNNYKPPRPTINSLVIKTAYGRYQPRPGGVR